VFTDIYSSNETILSMAIQADGKIVTGGFTLESNGSKSDFALVRYNPDGSLDLSFGTAGKAISDFGSSEIGFCVAIQPDGKILVAGEQRAGGGRDSDFAIARYNQDGLLDNSFGVNGKLITDFGNGNDDYGRYLAIQPNGRIIVAGPSYNATDGDIAIARYLADFKVAVEDFSFWNNTIIYPNPVSDKLILKFELPADLTISLKLTGLDGKRLYSFLDKRNFAAGNNEVELLFPPWLETGEYLLQITTLQGSAALKIHKQ